RSPRRGGCERSPCPATMSVRCRNAGSWPNGRPAEGGPLRYDPATVLRSLDNHKTVLIPFAVAFVLNYVWFIDAMRVARREQRYSMPIAATFVFMAHDSAYVGHYS